jgi:hypothetical protein
MSQRLGTQRELQSQRTVQNISGHAWPVQGGVASCLMGGEQVGNEAAQGAEPVIWPLGQPC